VLGSVGYLSEYRCALCASSARSRAAEEVVQLMATGTVKWFSAQKGCGFIVPDDGGTPLYVDHREIVGADLEKLTVDTKVRFGAQEGEYGLEATNVTFSTA
jgi:cold shock protein